MLQHITVENIALIERLDLDFDSGFNVLTGETGAGKSIIIDSLSLSLGGRFSLEMIRTGAESAKIEAVFDITGLNELEAFLHESDIETEEDHTLIIHREINISGKNRCRVNETTVTVSLLAKIGEYLIDIHGQHEHQSLLFPEKQLDLLDEYCGAEVLRLRESFKTDFLEWQRVKHTYRGLQQNEADLARRVDLLQFESGEIDRAALVIGEDDSLQKEKELLNASEKLFVVATEAYQSLVDNENGQHTAIEQLSTTAHLLTQGAALDERLNEMNETIKDILCRAEDIGHELRTYSEQIQFSPERLGEIDDRLDEINRLKRKYGNSIEEIIAYGERCHLELDEISNREEHSKNLEADLERLQGKLDAIGAQLSEQRHAGAERLQQDIERQLADLNMEKTQFRINITSGEYTNNGIDSVEFLVAPNLGESLKPMTKIASGGELSRMMLALKTILSELDQTPTMVFDEIDVGIGGRTAQAVAEKILFIGQVRQVLCITHLPQIASMAKRHFYIEKQVIGERTVVSVQDLMMNERIDELSRMLGGAAVTDTTRQHAREMLTMAEELRLKKVGRLN